MQLTHHDSVSLRISDMNKQRGDKVFREYLYHFVKGVCKLFVFLIFLFATIMVK